MSGYQITIKVYNSFHGHGAIPHSFVTISGPGLTRPVTIGYYPQQRGVSGPGTVKNDALAQEVLHTDGPPTFEPHAHDQSYTFDIGAQQALNTLQFAAGVANNPGTYQLLGGQDKSTWVMANGYQCTGFARDLMRVAGIWPPTDGPIDAEMPSYLGADTLLAYPGTNSLLFKLFDSNKYQPFRGTPTSEDFSLVTSQLYTGIKKFHALDKTPTSWIAVPNPDTDLTPTQRNNLTAGLSASGYAIGSTQIFGLGSTGMAFQVTVIRDQEGRVAEIRTPGRVVNGMFEALGPPVVKANTSSGQILNLGVGDPATGVNPVHVDAAPGLDTPVRISADYISSNGAASHSVTVNAGGTISDIWLLQKKAGNVFTLEEFGKAIIANNPGITDINKVQAGQVIFVPQMRADGSIDYTYPNGIQINSNPVTGEYLMKVPNNPTEGGFTVYERKADGDAGYVVRQTSTNGAGATTFASTGFQATLDADVKNLSTYTLNGVGNYNAATALGGAVVEFNASRVKDDEYLPTGITSINGSPVTSGIDSADLLAMGFATADSTRAEAIIRGLDPVTQAASGSPAPQVQVFDLPGGQTWHQLEVAGGTFSTLRGLDGKVINATFTRRLGGGVTVNEVTDANGNALYTEKIEPVLTGANAGSIKETMLKPDGSGYIRTRNADGSVREGSMVTIAPYDQRLASVFSDIPSVINAIKAGKPLPILASGLSLLNRMDQLTTPGGSMPALNTASTIAAGAMSLVNLANAFEHGSAFDKVSATAFALNSTTNALLAAGVLEKSSLAVQLFGSGSGLASALPYLGLITSLQSGDPVGITMSIGTLLNPGFLTSPVGWVLTGVSILRALFSDNTPPKAWGTANVTFGEGITNYGATVNATGENFGPDRVRPQLQNLVDALASIAAQNNAATADSSQRIGIIPQRLPSLNFKANEFADKGYAIADIDPLTGAQRFANVRFDDQGQLFGIDPAAVTPELRAMLSLPGAPGYPGLSAYMLNAALQRGALAPMWEVQTAKMQQTAGDPNAGLSEEERAAKAGLAAALDTAYAAAHPNDVMAKTKRVGHFMPIGIDLDALNRSATGVGSVNTLSIAQTEASGHAINFDWDGSGYRKQTGWVGANDGFLVLDRNFNASVDSGAELLSNPLVADPAKGLRSLAAFDANGDGRIDALDPVYNQLKVWQDLDQDGNNTHTVTIGTTTALAQDEMGGKKELRSLAELGITAIDYSNSRYVFKSTSSPGGGGYGAVSTLKLEAKDEGVIYTPVRGGILITATDGKPEVLVTQVQSDAAVYHALALETAGETVHLSEDGYGAPRNPNQGDALVKLTVTAAQLLSNETWHGLSGLAAGLKITGVGAASHMNGLAIENGNVTFTLEANYNGVAGFEYTVTSIDGQTKKAYATLNVAAVNDVPVVSVAMDAGRNVYGYTTLSYRSGMFFFGILGAVPGSPIYAPTQQNSWPIATESPNSGSVAATDPDGVTTFNYEVVTGPLYGRVALNSSTGRWEYLGLRPSEHKVTDIGSGEWLDVASGWRQYRQPSTNVYSNRYIGNEGSFEDKFTIRVLDGAGGYVDKVVSATHYGPPPAAIVQGSGGKKPIAIDLDGNGFAFTDINDSNVFMDVNGDGWKRRMAWVKPGDGLLAFDKDGNGKIESADEFAFVGYAPGQQTDMAALREAFDSNKNGVLDAGDAKWRQFGVWQDANSNGVQEAGEYKTLSDLGFSSIGLQSDGHFQVINGQTVHGLAQATKADGTKLSVADVTLRTSNEAQVPTPDANGGPATNTTVVVSKFGQGQSFVGTAGKDLVLGTAASDAFNTGEGDDVIMDDGGNDVVEAGAGNDLIYSGIDNDVINAGAGNDTVFAGAGNDVVFGDDATAAAGDDVIMLEDGNDVAFGGGGADFISGGTGNDVLSGNQGNDQLFGEGGWDALFGQEGDDELWGMEGNDLLEGGEGHDLLSGGAGDDDLWGGAGDDTYEVDAVGDTVTELVRVGLNAGQDAGGTDTVRASISYTLATALENLALSGLADIDGTGNAADNVLVGNAGRNTLTGLAGNDVLDGGAGADTLVGGLGDDSYMVDHVGDVLTELAGEGTDMVQARVSFSLSAHVENLNLVGINAIDGTGNGAANVLVGNAAANTLSGGAGNDVLRGGRGNDSYVFAVGDGADTIEELDATLDNLDRIVFAAGLSTSVVTGKRSGQDFVLGYSATDSITLKNWYDGAAQKLEQIVFANGTTWGAQQIAALTNHAPTVTHDLAAQLLTETWAFSYVIPADTFADEDVGDTLSLSIQLADGSALPAWLRFNAETRTLYGSPRETEAGPLTLSVRATDQFGVVAATDLHLDIANLVTGTAGNDKLNGTVWRDVIDGRAGSDVMVGGAGDDMFLINGTDVRADSFQGDAGYDQILGGTGDDTIRVHTFSGTATVERIDGGAGTNVIAGTSDSWDVIDLSNTEVLNIAYIDAGAGIDTVIGSAGNDVIIGGTSSDALKGGAGDDTFLIYGTDTGADGFQGDAGFDQILGGAGDDTIRVRTFSGAATVERIDGGAGTNVIAGTSDSWDVIDLSNTEVLNIAYIDAGAGIDTVIGSAGNDVIIGGTSSDALKGGAGDDTFLIYGTDTGADGFQGDAGFDQILGGAGDDTIRVRTFSGAATVERIDGGAGTNVIAGISDSWDVIDLSNTEVLNIAYIDAGAGIDTVIGSAGNDVILGGSSADRLSGGAGDDWISGGTGSDILNGGTGNNLFAFNKGDGADAINRTVAEGTWGTDTLSLGGGIAYANLNLTKSGKDLRLDTGTGDSISLKNWYSADANRGIGKLQMVTLGGDYDAVSSDITKYKQIEQFDFTKLVRAFDAACLATPDAANGWSMMNSLLDAHLLASDTQALGGDLSLQYATTASLSGVGLLAAPTALQTLKPKT